MAVVTLCGLVTCGAEPKSNAAPPQLVQMAFAQGAGLTADQLTYVHHWTCTRIEKGRALLCRIGWDDYQRLPDAMQQKFTSTQVTFTQLPGRAWQMR